MGDKQTQKSGDESVNIQAQTLNLGLTYADARQMALDVFEANFYRLSHEAGEVAKRRAEELVDTYLKQLATDNPAAVNSSSDPDMQYALFTAQKEYARSGDTDLQSVLVDILVARAGATSRSMRQIVLNESLSVAAKLTADQFDLLSLIFLLRYTTVGRVNDIRSFYGYLEGSVEPFMSSLPADELSYQHLEYTGCGSLDLSNKYLIDGAFLMYHKGLFQRGLTKDQINGFLEEGAFAKYGSLFTPCPRGENLYQIVGNDEKLVRSVGRANNCPPELIDKLVSLQNQNTMNPGELRDEIGSHRPRFKDLFRAWDASPLGFFTLTTVGMAIAHANLKRKINDRSDLSDWIR